MSRTNKNKPEQEKEYLTDLNPFPPINNPVNYESPAYQDFNPEELFNAEATGGGEQNQAKELFNPKNPKIKSELTNTELLIISRLYTISKEYYEPMGIFTLKEVLDELIMLKISKDRKSRMEFVEAHKEAKRDGTNGFFSRMFGGNNLT